MIEIITSISMFISEKEPILCSEEIVVLPLHYRSEKGAVEHNKIPLLQSFCNPVECTEPPPATEGVLPPETAEESTMLPFHFLSERSLLEHSNLPLFQRFCNPVECTERSSAVEEILQD